MKDTIKKISETWLDYRKYCIGESTSGYEVKVVKQDHPTYLLIKDKWQNEISNKVNNKKYEVESSVGHGNLGVIPWLAVMDKSVTDSATKGFYVVYLFSRSTKKLYLTIALGSFQFEMIYGRNNTCLEKISDAKKRFQQLFDHLKPDSIVNNINLVEDEETFEDPIKGSSRFLVSSFEKCVCFAKEYDVKNIDNYDLDKDLKEFLTSYDEIINDPQAENLDIIVESTLKIQKASILDYQIPSFKPREREPKKRKVSIVHVAKQKRRTQQSKKIGTAGEEHVYEYEFNKLKKLNKEDLAKKIQRHYANNEYPGWDITSYDEQGEEIYIEVKSTSGKIINSVEITENEWRAASTNYNKYYIYLVNNALTKNIKIIEKINNPKLLVDKKTIEISTSVFELKF